MSDIEDYSGCDDIEAGTSDDNIREIGTSFDNIREPGFTDIIETGFNNIIKILGQHRPMMTMLGKEGQVITIQEHTVLE